MSHFPFDASRTINGIITVVPPASGQGAIVVSGSNTVGGASYIDFIKVINTSASATNINKTFRVDGAGQLEIVNSAYGQVIFSLANNGNLSVNGGSAATSVSQDGTSGSLRFNNNNSQIYDDGNFHIHARGSGNTMWVNTNNGPINMLTQIPISGGAVGTGVTIGGDGTSNGFLTVSGSKSITTAASYGYLTNQASPAGQYGGGSQTINVSIYAKDRIQGQEIDALSDERMKDVQGEIPTEDAVRLVNTLKPIKYTWKDSEDKGLKTGFSAQQVIKSGFGHLVSAIPKEGMQEIIEEDGFVSPKDAQLVMNYDQVVPYHNVVIKHLLEKIEKLEQTILELKTSRDNA